MIKIDKKQLNYLLKNGFKFGENLHHTVGKGNKKTYYATESKKVLDCLKQIS